MLFSQSAVATLLFAASVSARCVKPSYSAWPIAPTETIATSSSLTPTSTSVTVAATTPTTTPEPTTVVATPTTTSSSASSSASAPAATSGLSTDEQNALDAHNAARSEVGEAALTWDASLVSAAQEWANTLASRGSGQLEHGSTGENLYWQSGGSDPYTAAADAWIAEKADYTSGTAIPSSGDASWMHYSQVIWGSTTKVGMAIAEDSAGGTYVVARYDPPGNYIGEVPTET